jgi:hypothetical protein
MLSDPVRGQSDPILEGDAKLFKPALRLMSVYRLVIEEITDAAVTTSYSCTVSQFSPSASFHEAVNVCGITCSI